MKRSINRNGTHSQSPKNPSLLPKQPPKQVAKRTGFRLEKGQLLKMHDLMIKARVLEERLIRMYKQSQGYFWLGGPGEEAFQIPLGLQIYQGQGLDYDFLHFHYRQGPTMLCMGMDPKDAMRQMANTATDPFSGGRNFASHYSRRAWNVTPVTSTIETQYLTATGGGIAHARHGGKGITIVTGGDAGSAEGDFASCLIWASRPALPLPMLIIVTNNRYGISTPYAGQHGEQYVSDRGKAFGIRTASINGNDLEESWFAIKEAMDYVRKERKPFLLEARVSRLYGHSSASGANFHPEEEDPIVTFEKRLEAEGLMTRAEMDQLREKYNLEMQQMANEVRKEPMPDPSTIWDHTFCGQKGKFY